MTSIERTAYPRLKRYYTFHELHQIYTPTLSEQKMGLTHGTGENHYLNLMVLLKVFQRLGYFPALSEINPQIIEHIHQVLSLSTEKNLLYQTRRTLYRHQQLIRNYLQIQPFNKAAKNLLQKKIKESAYVMDNPADLINVALEELVKHRYELPSFRELDRQVNHLRTQINQQLFEQTLQKLEPDLLTQFQALLASHPLEKLSPFNQLKKLPRQPTRNHLNELLIHHCWLMSLGEISVYLKHLTRTKVKHFASEARNLDAASVKDLNLAKQITIVLCLIHEAQVDSHDDLVEMFLKRIGTIHKKGKEKLDSLRQEQQSTSERLLSTFQEVLQVLSDEEKPSSSEDLLQSVQAKLNESGGVEELLNQCETLTAYKGNNYYPLLWHFYKSHRSVFFRLIQALEFESTTSDQRLINALQFLRENEGRRGEWLIGKLDLSFASKEWQKLVIVKQEDLTKVVRRHFEVCLFSSLAFELKSGDICVKGSGDYADWRQQLLSWEACQEILPDFCANLDLPTEATQLVDCLQNSLRETAEKVDLNYPNNGQVIINEQGEPTLKKVSARPISPTLKNLEAIIAERMPNHHLIDILRNVDYWTNFTRHFGPLSGSEPKLSNPTERYLLTTFTYGCNLGATQAARHMRGLVSAKSLMTVNRRHISIETLNKAITNIVNRYHVLDLPKLWGQGNYAAADGTKYDVREQNLLSEYHIRYGGYGGIAYHHVADKYIALFSHFIPCGTWEAVYIIEGLLQNKSDLQPQTIHADTQGQSTPVFALSYLLGIKLMPRIRNWKDLIFYRPDPQTVYQHIDSLFKDSINWEIIRTHWTDLMQVVLSIHTGKISSSVLLRKLGNYSRKNRLYRAFRELGRVIRTIFLLEYISDLKLRQQITAATNKVEAYHGFSKWFFFGGDQIIASDDRNEMEKRIKYNDLVANAVIFQNVVDLTDILLQLQREGYLLDKEDIAALSPYLTSHLKRFGDYILDLNQIPKNLEENMILTLL